MDKYCVEDLNHLDDNSVNLFHSKDPTIKNENFIYFKTEDFKIDENDVLVSTNTDGVIESLTACNSTDGVAHLKNEFIPEDCVPGETVVEKIEITEHPLEFHTLQERKYTINETKNLKIEETLKEWLSKAKLLVEKTLETSRGSIHSGRPKKMSRDIKTNKNKVTSGSNKNRTPKTGIEDVEQQEVDMEEEYKCHDCNKVLINRKSLKHHIKQCHEDCNTQTFQCYHCNKIVQRRRSLILHLRQWHTEGDKLFHCDSCTYQTNVRQAIVHHVYRAHVPNDQKPSFKCKLCPYEGKLKGNLQVHINQVHLRNTKTRKCDQCDWEGYSSNFSRHIRTKHLGEEFICDKCNYKSNRKTNLISHQLVHSKAKQFSCPNCTYQTNYKSTLKAHLKYHEDNI